MPKVYPYRWVILLIFMLINMVVQIQWLAHAAVARPAAVFYERQFDPASFFIMSAGPLGFQYAAEVSHPAPESTSQGMLLWVGQITGMIFVASMSIENNRYLPALMTAFAALSLLSAGVVLFLRESPMIITERDRLAESRS